MTPKPSFLFKDFLRAAGFDLPKEEGQ